MPLFPETKMADVGKLISLGNLLARKTTWFVLTTTFATSILFRDFGQELPIYTLVFQELILSISTHRDNTLSYTATYRDNSLLFILTHRDNTHSLSLSLSLSHIWFPAVNPTKCILSETIFFLILPLQLDLLQPRKQPQKFRQTTEKKQTNNIGEHN